MPQTLVKTSTDYAVTDHDLVFTETDPQYVLRVKDLPEDERPRERMLHSGATNLSVAELVAILWGVGNRNEDVLAMARRTLREYGEKAIASEFNPQRLSQTAEISLNKACQIVASLELGRRFYARQTSGRPVHVRNAKQAYQYLKEIGTNQKEQLRGLYLNSRYRVVHDEVISIGSLTSNVVHPREVFQPAIERGAVAIILAHNHPSGQLEPTTPDIHITEQLIAAGKVLGIELLDHLVITPGQYVSILEMIEGKD
ncbi:MAG TPA: DNA repair protein RadC [Candidatus Saccharimonadales bacterium]|nr:DNA repair protein RadC [Candidatus Saccharimonadales bacterium]